MSKRHSALVSTTKWVANRPLFAHIQHLPAGPREGWVYWPGLCVSWGLPPKLVGYIELTSQITHITRPLKFASKSANLSYIGNLFSDSWGKFNLPPVYIKLMFHWSGSNPVYTSYSMFRLLESASQVDLDSKVTDIPRSCVRGLLAKDISSLRSLRNLTASNFAYSLALKPLGKLSSKNGPRGANYTHTSDNHSLHFEMPRLRTCHQSRQYLRLNFGFRRGVVCPFSPPMVWVYPRQWQIFLSVATAMETLPTLLLLVTMVFGGSHDTIEL